MNDAAPRFEFRVWSDELAAPAAQIAGAAELVTQRESSELYVLVASSAAVNPKIRDDVLDVKVLLDAVDRFERWEPRLGLPFPVRASRVAGDFFPLIGLEPPELRQASYTAPEFVEDVVGSHPLLDVVEVAKQRTMYRLSGCIAEVSDVTLAGRHRQTIAVESADLGRLQVVRSRLGLDLYENQSYPSALREMLGRPRPEGGTGGR
jgi:hypothetical protein